MIELIESFEDMMPTRALAVIAFWVWMVCLGIGAGLGFVVFWL